MSVAYAKAGQIYRPTNVYEHEVGADETTASLTYVNLATVGPFVSLVTGTEALVIYNAYTYWGGQGENSFLSVAVTGATALPAADDIRMMTVSSEGNAFSQMMMHSCLITGLTPGVNVFTLKYRVSGQTWHFGARRLIVIP